MTAASQGNAHRMPGDRTGPYVYLAGPDVFYPNPAARASQMKEALLARGMLGLFPLDNALDPANHPGPGDLALAIARANEASMRKAGICIANIQPWRGPEADDGTSYEIGFMAALGKLIVLHTNDRRSFAARITDDTYKGEVYWDGAFRRGGTDHMTVEDFDGFADNLMLINAAVSSAERTLRIKADPAGIVHYSFEAAADFAKTLWDARR